MGCGCQGRADLIARQWHEHPHRSLGATVAIGIISVIIGAAGVVLVLRPKMRDARGGAQGER